MRNHEHVARVWAHYDPRPIEVAVDEVTLSALARFDPAMLTEAADLVVRTSGRLNPALWLRKARFGNRLYTDLGAGIAPAVSKRHLPSGFDPFASDQPATESHPPVPRPAPATPTPAEARTPAVQSPDALFGDVRGA